MLYLNHTSETEKTNFRFNILTTCTYLVGIIILIQLFNVQILNGTEYRQTSNTKLTRESRIEAVRGSILDSSGNVLVSTDMTFSLEMYKTIKNVVLNSETEFFSASLRHSTSYPFYQMLKEKGIIDEFMDALSVNLCSDETYEQIANKVSRYDATLEELLETGKFT